MPRIGGIIWLEEISEKLWRKHRVGESEVADLLANDPQFRFVESGDREGEDVYSASGQSSSGRYLIVFFVWKKSTEALIVSARKMTPTERKRYGKK